MKYITPKTRVVNFVLHLVNYVMCYVKFGVHIDHQII